MIGPIEDELVLAYKLNRYIPFALEHIGVVKGVSVQFGDNDSDYNDEYYTGSSVEIAFYVNGHQFMNEDDQGAYYDQGEVEDDDDEYAKALGIEQRKPLPDPGDYFVALGKLPFVWTGKNYTIKLGD